MPDATDNLDRGSAVKLERDHRCARCGYSLRGAGTGGRCPECALPIEESIRPFGAGPAAAARVRRARSGLLLIVFGLPVMICGFIGSDYLVTSSDIEWLQNSAMVLAVVLLLPVLIGHWWFAARLAGPELAAHEARATRAIRFGLVLFVAAWTASLGWEAMVYREYDPAQPRPPWRLYGDMLVAVTLGIAQLVAVVSLLSGTMRRAQWMAARLGARRWSRSAGVYAWLISGVTATASLVNVAFSLLLPEMLTAGPSPHLNRIISVVLVVAAISGPASLIAMALYWHLLLALMLRLRRVLFWLEGIDGVAPRA